MCTIRLIELTVAWQNSKPVNKLSYTKNSAVYLSDYRVMFIFVFRKMQELRSPTIIFFSEKTKTWNLMWIVCLVDDSHGMSSLIFSEMYQTKFVCCSYDKRFKG